MNEMWLLGNDGMLLTGENRSSQRSVSQCHFVHCQSQQDWHMARNFAVRGWQITAWAVAPSWLFSLLNEPGLVTGVKYSSYGHKLCGMCTRIYNCFTIRPNLSVLHSNNTSTCHPEDDRIASKRVCWLWSKYIVTNLPYNWRIKNQLDATYYFIVLLIGSTCFGHYYVHHQEFATIMLITTLVVSFLVCCRLEVRCG